jgi:hypothetical protein
VIVFDFIEKSRLCLYSTLLTVLVRFTCMGTVTKSSYKMNFQIQHLCHHLISSAYNSDTQLLCKLIRIDNV